MLPPPTNSFMREINALKHTVFIFQEGQDRINQQIAQQITLIKAIEQMIVTNNQAIEQIIATNSQKINQVITDAKKQTDQKLVTITRHCNALDNREKQLLRDKRFLEQTIFGEVPNFEQVLLELTNHCAYNCFFCPRQQMQRARGVMSDESIRVVAQRLGIQTKKNIIVWTDGMGEVMLLKEFFDKVRLIKSVMPNARPYVVTTLGYEKADAYWDEFLQIGIKRMQVSIYGYDKETYLLLHGVDRLELVLSNLSCLIAKNEALGNPLEIQLSVEDFGREFFDRFEHFDYEKHVALREQFISELKEHSGIMILRRKIHNRGRAFHFANPQLNIKRCFVEDYPTRQNKLYITWDLNVLPCPMIFDNEIVFGNLKDQSLEEIYTGDTFKKFVEQLRSGNFGDYPSCKNCNL